MYWILAAIFLLMLLAVPRLRPVGLVGCVVLGVLLAWGMAQRLRGNDPGQTPGVERRGLPTSPAAVLHSIPLESVGAENLQLSGSGAPFELRGRIVNRSRDTLLKSVTIRVIRQDCYEGALDPSGCATLWQDRHLVALSVPPGQARDFAGSIWMRGAAPRPRGRIQDSFEVVAASGQALTSDEL